MENPTPVTMVTDEDKALTTKFYDLWIVGGYNPQEIADNYNCSVERVSRILRYAHIFYRKKFQENERLKEEHGLEIGRHINEKNKAISDYSKSVIAKRELQEKLNDVYSKIRDGKIDEIVVPACNNKTCFVDDAIKENLMLNVEDFEFSVRALTVFRNEGIKTIGDIVERTEANLLRTPNFGRKSLNETKEILQSLGLFLKLKDE